MCIHTNGSSRRISFKLHYSLCVYDAVASDLSMLCQVNSRWKVFTFHNCFESSSLNTFYLYWCVWHDLKLVYSIIALLQWEPLKLNVVYTHWYTPSFWKDVLPQLQYLDPHEISQPTFLQLLHVHFDKQHAMVAIGAVREDGWEEGGGGATSIYVSQGAICHLTNCMSEK